MALGDYLRDAQLIAIALEQQLEAEKRARARAVAEAEASATERVRSWCHDDAYATRVMMHTLQGSHMRSSVSI